MREPNFSESQLQQAVNTAFIRYIYEKKGEWVFANVPSLHAEYELGWDSAFNFPWMPYPILEDHEGSNFFIQYKLSCELTSSGAKEWDHWRSSYFRFKIPHITKDKYGAFIDDYHQWDRLCDLAKRNYPTFYATNSTLDKDDLRLYSNNGSLLDETPFLDMRGVNERHKHVTFTRNNEFFLLHSEAEKIPSLGIEKISGLLEQSEKVDFSESSIELLGTLKEIWRDEENWNNDILQIDRALQVIELDLPDPIRWLRIRAMLVSFVRRHIGAELIWYPANG